MPTAVGDEAIADPTVDGFAMGCLADKTVKLFRLSPITNAQTGTTYTLLASDNGKTVTFNNASAITLTVPSGLGAEFACKLVQLGAGQLTITASGVTINNVAGGNKISAQYGSAYLHAYAANTFLLDGSVVP